MYMVFNRKNIHFNIFRPKASSVKLNLFTPYISLLYKNLSYFSLIQITYA